MAHAFSWERSLLRKNGRYQVPAVWNRPNCGNPIPGPRSFGGPGKVGMVALSGPSGGMPHKLAKISPLLHYSPPLQPCTSDRALAKLEESGPGSQERKTEQRTRYVKQVYFRWNLAKLREVYFYDYVKHRIPIRTYYGARKKQSDMVNWNIAKDVFNPGPKTAYMPHYYNRRENPYVLKKDPVKSAEGEIKWGPRGGKRGLDPFIRDGHKMQLHGAIRLKNNDYRTDAWHFQPTGVPHDLGRWAHWPSVQHHVHRMMAMQTLRGKNNFFAQIGALAIGKSRQQNWFMDLLSMPINRVRKIHHSIDGPRQNWLKIAAQRGKEVRRRLVGERDFAPRSDLALSPFERGRDPGTAGTIYGCGAHVLRTCRMERQEYS
eukprot:TRINITY_DN50668_c0_g1_i1.p1 TRINITY_DN50668_c0_g1~~TRINITY_DN50668_c0_g1_i1.p1  ORF type:complete len:374 (+),score=85.61 TRINITY_DN50668_c0_g1_i1:130-1251(+)